MTDTAVIEARPRQPTIDRPDIPLPNGDVLKPRVRLAAQLGVCPKTLERMGVDTTYVAAVAYCSQRSALQIIANGLGKPRRPW